MGQNTQPTEEERKTQERMAFQNRLERGNARPNTVKTDKQMESIRFRIINQGQVTPVLAMSTR